MNADDLKQLQSPLKKQYSDSPETALARLHATGVIELNSISCRVSSPFAENEMTVSGLHTKAGGDESLACSGDMLLQSLVACSGVTFAAVATAMNLEITSASVTATADMDFRGTLGVNRDTPVGLTSVALEFDVNSPEPDEKIDKLIQLTERYCVVLQTLASGVSVTSGRHLP